MACLWNTTTFSILATTSSVATSSFHICCRLGASGEVALFVKAGKLVTVASFIAAAKFCDCNHVQSPLPSLLSIAALAGVAVLAILPSSTPLPQA